MTRPSFDAAAQKTTAGHAATPTESRCGHFLEQVEKALLPRGGDRPVDGDRLVAVVERLIFHAEVEVSPRGILRDGGEEVVVRLVEVEVVVFVEEDGLVFV